MKTTSLLISLVAFTATAALGACGGNTGGSATTSSTTQGTGGGVTVTDAFDSTFSLTCDGPDDDPTSGSATTSMLERCIYNASSSALAFNVENGDQDGAINIDVANFHGVGTYTTTTGEGGDGDTTVYVSTGLVTAGTWESDPPGSWGAHTCTIRVEQTNLTEVEIPAGSTAWGYIVLSLECPVLGNGAVGELTCQLTPSTFTFSVAKCMATE